MKAQTGIVVAAMGIVFATAPSAVAQRSRGNAAPPAHYAKQAAPTSFSYIPGKLYPTSTGGITPSSPYYRGNAGEGRANGNRAGHNNDGRNNGGRNSGGRNNGVGYLGFYGGVPYLPYLDTTSISTFPGYSDQVAQMEAQGGGSGGNYLPDGVSQQLDQMSGEIRQLREAQQNSTPPAYPAPTTYAPPSPAAATDAQPSQAPIVLILQNGNRLTTHNYAVMNGTIWDFSKQPARKIAVASINLAESEKATESNGGEFPHLSAKP